MDEKPGQLKQPGEFRDARALGEAEFEVEKNQVLNG